MAATSPMVTPFSDSPLMHSKPKMMTCIKTLSETGLTSIPDIYVHSTEPDEQVVEESVPVIDFSLLTSSNPEERSKAIDELGRASREWGFFMVINHGVPEKLVNDMLDISKKFHDLTEEEKQEYVGKHVIDAIRYGTSSSAVVGKVFLWRDFLKIFVHPKFHSPTKPDGFSEISYEYSKRTREVARELVRGISESLGLDRYYIEKAVNLDDGLQTLIANLYPPCPQPELARGVPPHTDHGLMTLLTQNGVDGLQVIHNGKWVKINGIPNAYLVNLADHMEILTNGKCKSALHRSFVSKDKTRLSIAMGHGPSVEAVVGPAPELLDDENPAGYISMKYQDYIKIQQGDKRDEKAFLDRMRIKKN